MSLQRLPIVFWGRFMQVGKCIQKPPFFRTLECARCLDICEKAFTIPDLHGMAPRRAGRSWRVYVTENSSVRKIPQNRGACLKVVLRWAAPHANGPRNAAESASASARKQLGEHLDICRVRGTWQFPSDPQTMTAWCKKMRNVPYPEAASNMPWAP